MKIALIGEFSSLHKFLKEGLLEIGEEVILASNGDGYKLIKGADLELPSMVNAHSVSQRISYKQDIKKLQQIVQGYDVVQIIYTNLFSLFDNTEAIKGIKNNNLIMSLVSAGSDYGYYRAYKTGRYRYHLYNYFMPSMYNKGIKGLIERHSAIQVEKMSDIVIPSLYEYKLGYEGAKVYNIIPFPINVSQIEYRDNVVNDKVIFFHGLNREIKKGTPLIREALERLQEKYPKDVEVIIEGHMPFDKYMELMQKVNVVIDQTYGYGYGINSCLALAQGKIVINPCKQEQIDAMGADYNPFVSILPDVDDIFNKLCFVLENKKEFGEMSLRGRSFVETYHDHVMIARKYLEAWKSVM